MEKPLHIRYPVLSITSLLSSSGKSLKITTSFLVTRQECRIQKWQENRALSGKSNHKSPHIHTHTQHLSLNLCTMTTMYSRTIRVCPSLTYIHYYTEPSPIPQQITTSKQEYPLGWSEVKNTANVRLIIDSDNNWLILVEQHWIRRRRGDREIKVKEKTQRIENKPERERIGDMGGVCISCHIYILICCLDRRQHHTLLGVFNDKKNHNRVYCMKGYVCFMHRNNNRVKAERKRRPTKVEP